GKSKDLASTFLDPAGTRPINASGFIGFKTGDADVVLSSLLLFPNVISSKRPFATSFMVPSPPNATIFLNPFLKKSLVRVVPSPDFWLTTTSGFSPKISLI
ncbi:MAG: hypothetical protein WA220_08015, partial [Candidatus Nitrosopolaris sp.]